jgi:hypothetical protein
MNCNRKEENLERCNCTYQGCPRAGTCCQCIAYHRQKDELPACYFPKAAEATYDRSIESFIRIYQEN